VTPVIQSVEESALDANQESGHFTSAIGSANQSTVVTPIGILAGSLSETGAQLLPLAGSSRAEAFSELRIMSLWDEDVAFTPDGVVDRSGGCTSFHPHRLLVAREQRRE
jgi:hypothetical protein